jgi:hypothetical protein
VTAENIDPDRDDLVLRALQELPDYFGPRDLERLGVTLEDVAGAALLADYDVRVPARLLDPPSLFQYEWDATVAADEQAREDAPASEVETDPWADGDVVDENWAAPRDYDDPFGVDEPLRCHEVQSTAAVGTADPWRPDSAEPATGARRSGRAVTAGSAGGADDRPRREPRLAQLREHDPVWVDQILADADALPPHDRSLRAELLRRQANAIRCEAAAAFQVGDIVRNRHTGATLTVTEPLSDWSAQYYEPVLPDGHVSGVDRAESIDRQGPDPWRPPHAAPATAPRPGVAVNADTEPRVVERPDRYEPNIPDPRENLAEQVQVDREYAHGMATNASPGNDLDAVRARVEQLPDGMITDEDLARVGVTPEQFAHLADASAELQAEQWRSGYAAEQERKARWRTHCAVERASEAVRELRELADAQADADAAEAAGTDQLARWHAADVAAQEALRESDRVLAGEVRGDA